MYTFSLNELMLLGGIAVCLVVIGSIIGYLYGYSCGEARAALRLLASFGGKKE